MTGDAANCFHSILAKGRFAMNTIRQLKIMHFEWQNPY
jgi:hypothetical protein